MRNLAEVIDKMLEVIPPKHPVRVGLESVKAASTFKAPEIMADCWHDTATVLASMIEPLDRGSEWALKVRDIFAGRE